MVVEHLPSLWESPGVVLRTGGGGLGKRERAPYQTLIILTFRLYTKKTEKEDTRCSHQHKTIYPRWKVQSKQGVSYKLNTRQHPNAYKNPMMCNILLVSTRARKTKIKIQTNIKIKEV